MIAWSPPLPSAISITALADSTFLIPVSPSSENAILNVAGTLSGNSTVFTSFNILNLSSVIFSIDAWFATQ